MQYLPGSTVQCLNPNCSARGHWLRVQDRIQESCGDCGMQLQNVPPPIMPRFRPRPRPLATYRPMGRSR